ncbi:MAG TPA: hypothetical protein VFE51_21025 [Verrucomicrobiae bacterium]|nr:hypothetical protein [Verrucomicrobiae bacterium]
MAVTLHMKLPDSELRERLATGTSLLFDGSRVDWHEIERQVDRMGFGDCYIVSEAKRGLSDVPTISVRPVGMASLAPG